MGVLTRPENAVISGYYKDYYESFGGKAGFVFQMGKHHEFKTGAEFHKHTLRVYGLPNSRVINIPVLQKSVADEDKRKVYFGLNNFGYDFYGNKIDDGIDGPKEPVFAAFYVQDKMEFSDLVLLAGLRLDYIDLDNEVFENPNNVKFDENGFVDQNHLIPLEPFLQVSPRLGFSFPITDRVVFHCHYGKFIQQSRLRDTYLGYGAMTNSVKNGGLFQPLGLGLRPERTTSYEFGFRQQLTDNFAFDITGYYKDIKDQVQMREIYSEPDADHKSYSAL